MNSFSHEPNAAPHVIGCDIGGANIKLADSHGRAAACSFPMWLTPNELGSCLSEMLQPFQPTKATQLAITMTGELADCFESRRDGVRRILQQTEQAFAPERTAVYAVGDRWLPPQQAIAAAWDVAASNWFALATWIGRRAKEPVDMVLDVGSTTVDIVPMVQGPSAQSRIASCARTDRDRLELGQLVYTGLERTPIAAILKSVQIGGHSCPLMAERFATSDDCYVLLGLAPEWPNDRDSADNRPRTKAFAHARLARMIGEDAETLSRESAMQMASQCIDAQAADIAQAIDRNLQGVEETACKVAKIVVAGHGRVLASRALGLLPHRSLDITWLADQLSPSLARCAPAVAVAELRAACFR